MTNDEKNQRTVHNVIMENRKSLTISGVTDVDSFDERCISLYTQMGELVIRGRELHINSMSVETGDMTIDGDIWALNYGDKDKRGTVSMLGKLFRQAVNYGGSGKLFYFRSAASVISAVMRFRYTHRNCF